LLKALEDTLLRELSTATGRKFYINIYVVPWASSLWNWLAYCDSDEL
jgi:hypothetical protein